MNIGRLRRSLLKITSKFLCMYLYQSSNRGGATPQRGMTKLEKNHIFGFFPKMYRFLKLSALKGCFKS